MSSVIGPFQRIASYISGYESRTFAQIEAALATDREQLADRLFRLWYLRLIKGVIPAGKLIPETYSCKKKTLDQLSILRKIEQGKRVDWPSRAIDRQEAQHLLYVLSQEPKAFEQGCQED